MSVYHIILGRPQDHVLNIILQIVYYSLFCGPLKKAHANIANIEKTGSTGSIPAPNCHNCNTSELESDQLFRAGQMPKTCVSSKPGDRGDDCAQGVNVAPLVTL